MLERNVQNKHYIDTDNEYVEDEMIVTKYLDKYIEVFVKPKFDYVEFHPCDWLTYCCFDVYNIKRDRISYCDKCPFYGDFKRFTYNEFIENFGIVNHKYWKVK